MARIKFHKMEGTGNDFVVIDNRDTKFTLDEIIAFTPKLCDRKFGIGADGLIALELPQRRGIDYTMTYRNADGSDAGMCGNGGRCLALFAASNGYALSQTFNVHNAVYKAEVDLEHNSVSVSFPDVNMPKEIELQQEPLIQLYTGTEHIVKFVDPEQLKLEKELIKKGSAIRHHNSFNPPGTNVNFICAKNGNTIHLQTYERGVENLTLACGTGAIASAIATHFKSKNKANDFEYEILVAGGTLTVSFSFNAASEKYTNIKLMGPAAFVFEGEIDV